MGWSCNKSLTIHTKDSVFDFHYCLVRFEDNNHDGARKRALRWSTITPLSICFHIDCKQSIMTYICLISLTSFFMNIWDLNTQLITLVLYIKRKFCIARLLNWKAFNLILVGWSFLYCRLFLVYRWCSWNHLHCVVYPKQMYSLFPTDSGQIQQCGRSFGFMEKWTEGKYAFFKGFPGEEWKRNYNPKCPIPIFWSNPFFFVLFG